MGKKASRARGWELRWRGAVASVRFRHEGQRYELGLGTHALASGAPDASSARAAAAEKYADVISGKFVKARRGVTAPIEMGDAIVKWIFAMAGSYDATTCETLKTYGRHWLAFFDRWSHVHEAGIGDYGRDRLGKVLRTTVLKERTFLSAFLSWCAERGWIAEVPPFPPLPKRAVGVRSGKQRAKAVPVTAEQVDRFLAELPVMSARSIKRGAARWPVRAFFVASWETGLRPETLRSLEVPKHYARGREALTITADVDKARYGREVPLTARARAALDEVAPDAGPIFGRHSYRKQVLRAAARAEMPKGFAPYDLRHGRATHLLAASGDNILGVGYLLGHKQATTTSTYLHAARTHGEAALAADVVDRDPKPSNIVYRGEFLRCGDPVGDLRDSCGNYGGDRRGLNPRHLEPQSSDSYETIQEFDGLKSARVGRNAGSVVSMGEHPQSGGYFGDPSEYIPVEGTEEPSTDVVEAAIAFVEPWMLVGALACLGATP